MPPSPITALIDLDAFFAQVEQLDHPEYRGLPIIIGGQPGGRGVVATASYEARRYGVHSAMPTNTAHKLCPDAIFVRGNMRRYAELSKRIYEVLQQISPEVEQASIDEFYIDLSGLEGLWGTPRQMGERCKQVILEATGLTSSVGIGPNRLIAKLASEYRKPDGLTVVGPDQVYPFLDPMPLKNLRGIGKKTLPRLAKLQVETLGELRRRYTLEQLQKAVGTGVAETLYYQSRGISRQRRRHHSRQSISKETTFEHDISAPQRLKKVLHNLAFEVARSLRKHEKRGHVVRIRVRLSDFSTFTRQRQLSHPTASDLEIARVGWELFKEHGYIGKEIRLLGIGVTLGVDEPEQPAQLDLFDSTADERPTQADEGEQVTQVVDAILDRFGEDAIKRGR